MNSNVRYQIHNQGHGPSQCQYCPGTYFHVPEEFVRHLVAKHCSQEGGSFVCLYGHNQVCSSLPLEGVDDKDYLAHVYKHHATLIFPKGMNLKASPRNDLRTNTGGQWGVYSSTQNIPAVLNDPRKGMKRDFFTRTWGETFVELKEIPPHIALPDVTIRHVESYVRRLRKRHKILRKASTSKHALLEGRSGHIRLASGSDQVVSTQEEVPSAFLSSSFDLKDPQIFYSVFTHISSSGISSRNAKLLQEKLFHFLETVEADMSHQISSKSSAFFDTMTHLNGQMDQLTLNHKAVSTLRDGVAKLRQEVVIEPTRMLALPRRRENIQKTCRKLELMSAVREVQVTIQVMLARQEYSAALDLIATTQDVLHSELSTIRCLRHLSSELTEHEKLIDKMVSMEFIRYITEDLNRPIDDTKALLDEYQLTAVVFGVLRLKKLDFIDSIKEEVEVAIKAAVKQAVAEAVSDAEIDHDTTSVADQARVLAVPAWLSLLTIITHRLRIIIRRVEAMVNVMMQAVEASAGCTSAKLEGVQAASIVSMSTAEGGVTPLLEESSCMEALTGLKEVLYMSCDFAHDRCEKLLRSKSRDQGLDKVSAKDFLLLSSIIESFVEDTRVICGRKSTSFQNGLQGQAVKFVSRFHEEREARLKLNLKNERWKSVPAPPDLQLLLDHIFSTWTLTFPPVKGQSRTDGELEGTCGSGKAPSSNYQFNERVPPDSSLASDSSAVSNCLGLTSASGHGCINGAVETVDRMKSKVVSSKEPSASTVSEASPRLEAEVMNHAQSAATDGNVQNMTSVGRSTGNVTVRGEEYAVVGVCVVVVRLIVEYADCAVTLRLVAQQLLNWLMELLRWFNANTCRLLIEAGAVTLGLKTITIRHLALAWRCLELLLTIMPLLNAHFAALLKPAIVEKHVGQLTKEYKEHCNAIESKIISVVSDILETQLEHWEAKSPVPSSAFSGILKSISKLHEAVSGILTQNQVQLLFDQITRVLQDKLQSHLTRLNVSSVGPQSCNFCSVIDHFMSQVLVMGHINNYASIL